MASILIKPHTSKFRPLHPATNENAFTKGKKKIKPYIELVGSNSSEFYNCVKAEDAIDILQEEDNSTARLVAACIVGWDKSGFIDEPYSKEAALEIMLDPNNLWLLNQLKEHIAQTANFFD